MQKESINRLRNAQRARDQALRRVGRVRRMTILGAGALTAGVAGLVSAVAPGHTLATKATSAPGVAHAVARAPSHHVAPSALRMPPLASAAQLGLQSPGAAPQPAPPPPASAPPASAPPQQSAPAPSAPAPTGGGVVSGGS